MSALLGTSRVVSLRLVTPWRGVWFADVDLDPDDPTAIPTGAVTLTVGTTNQVTLQGSVDPRGTGRFVSGVRVRVVGGGGGWDQAVAPQHFHNDGGVNSADVYQSTAAAVGEQANVATPTALGIDYVRSAGSAARVFGDLDWYVDLAGVTQVSSRPTATPDKSLEILDFDAGTQRLQVACDVIVLPGTTFTDARFDGTLTARDVEQVFDASGSRAQVWCGVAAASRLAGALQSMIREFSGRTYLRIYKYRFVNMNASRLNLQAVDPTPGLPDLLPLTVWPGMAGLSAKLSPSQIVLVCFLEGDPTQPVVIGFDGALPQEVHLDATGAVILQGGNAPVARLGDSVSVFFPPTIPFTGTISGAPVVGTMTIVTAAPGIIQSGNPKVLA